MLISIRWVVWKFCCMCSLVLSLVTSYMSAAWAVWCNVVNEYVFVYVCMYVFLFVCLYVFIWVEIMEIKIYRRTHAEWESDNRSSNKSVRWTSCAARLMISIILWNVSICSCFTIFYSSLYLSLSLCMSCWHVDLLCFSSILLPIWSIRLLYSYNV